VGGGLAGTATAMELNKKSIPCIVMESNYPIVLKPGETLAPNSLHIIQELDIETLLSAKQHCPNIGNMYNWGTNELKIRHFFLESSAVGWHIDRTFFEHQMIATAQSRGVHFLSGCRFTKFEKKKNLIFVHYTDALGKQHETIASFIVDASGRSSRVAKSAGIQRQTLDRLTGYCAKAKDLARSLGNRSFIESINDGWVYAAELEDKSLVLNYMTDADLQHVFPGDMKGWLFEKLQDTKYLRQFFKLSVSEDLYDITVKPASTSCLGSIVGQGWLAVGDAACSYDPLSSYGIVSALGGSIYAALAIQEYLNGSEAAMAAYASIQQKIFNNILLMLQHQYNLERRWLPSRFWERRHL
jgi:flavin-dependent dehydrogenase